jgi:hypothetical protein
VESGALHVEIDAAELSLMLEGIDLKDAKRSKRFRRSPHKAPKNVNDET